MPLGLVALVGAPNVGKSTIFNRIIGQRLSIVEDTPGITRDRLYGNATWLTKEFRVVDTGGIEIHKVPFREEIKAQVEIALAKKAYRIKTVRWLRCYTEPTSRFF